MSFFAALDSASDIKRVVQAGAPVAAMRCAAQHRMDIGLFRVVRNVGVAAASPAAWSVGGEKKADGRGNPAAGGSAETVFSNSGPNHNPLFR